jgi:outer membrane protein OmpA-like peptidoglycan-associated protein
MASFPENPGIASSRDNLGSESPDRSPEAQKQLENFFAHLATAIKGDAFTEEKRTQPTEKSGSNKPIISAEIMEFSTQSAAATASPPPEIEEKKLENGLKMEGWLDRLEPDRTEPETVVALEGLFALLKNETPSAVTAKSIDDLELSQLRQVNAQLTQKLTRLEEKLDASGQQAEQLSIAIFQLLNRIQQVENGKDPESEKKERGEQRERGARGGGNNENFGEKVSESERVFEKSWENPKSLEEKQPLTLPYPLDFPNETGLSSGVTPGSITSTDNQFLDNQLLVDTKAYSPHSDSNYIDTATLIPPQDDNSSLLRASNDSRKKLSLSLLGIGLAILGLIGIPFAIYHYFSLQERRIEENVAQALSSNPDLAVYRLEADVWRKQLQLKGRLPNPQLRHQAEEIAKSKAPSFQLENNIIVVEQPPDPVEVAAKVQEVVTALNQIDGISISASFESGKVTLEGTALQFTNIEKIAQTFSELSGVKSVSNQIQSKPGSIASRIYFSQDSDRVRSIDVDVKILPIKQLMQRYPNLKLKIVGYTHNTEYNKETLALERAQTVQNILEDRGIDRRRMKAVAGKDSPQDVASNQPRWFSRCVLFEIDRMEGNGE